MSDRNAGNREPHWPRALSRVRAAAYCSVTPQMFDRMVQDGLMPRPARFYDLQRWDRHAIDLALDAKFESEADTAPSYVFSNEPIRDIVTCDFPYRSTRGGPPRGSAEGGWLTDEEAKIWMEEYGQQKKQDVIRRPMTPTERRTLQKLALHRGETIASAQLGRKHGFGMLERLVWRGYAVQGPNNSAGEETFQITEEGVEAASRLES